MTPLSKLVHNFFDFRLVAKYFTGWNFVKNCFQSTTTSSTSSTTCTPPAQAAKYKSSPLLAARHLVARAARRLSRTATAALLSPLAADSDDVVEDTVQPMDETMMHESVVRFFVVL